MSSLVAAFFGYVFIRKKVFRRNVPINQEDYYFKMRWANILKKVLHEKRSSNLLMKKLYLYIQ